MTKVLECVATLIYGGAETVLYNYLSSMDRSGMQIDILVLYGNENTMQNDFEKLGCRVFTLKSNAKSFFARPKELKQFFKDGKYDVVHIHTGTSLKYRYAKIAKKAGVGQVIYHSHTSKADGIFKYLHRVFKGRLNRWCDKKYACSSLAGEFMFSGDFEVVNNAITLEKFAFDALEREKIRAQYGIENKLVIGNVGRLIPSKNHAFLIKLAERLVQIGINDFVFLCLGDGELKEQLNEEIASKNLSDKFIFTGLVRDVHRYYNAFDVMAFPSQYEGLGLVVIEAQANGCKVVASDRLPSETLATDGIVLYPIDETDENIQKWVDKILAFSKTERVSGVEELTKKGFEIKIEAEKLRQTYLKG